MAKIILIKTEKLNSLNLQKIWYIIKYRGTRTTLQVDVRVKDITQNDNFFQSP